MKTEAFIRTKIDPYKSVKGFNLTDQETGKYLKLLKGSRSTNFNFCTNQISHSSLLLNLQSLPHLNVSSPLLV